jgi:hypothetical protein
MSRWFGRSAIALFAVAVAVACSSQAALAASYTFRASPSVLPPSTLQTPVALPTGDLCSSVIPRLVALGAGKKGACVSSFHTQTASPAITGGASSTSATQDPATIDCVTQDQPGLWIYSRESFCQLYDTQVETVLTQSDGTVQVVGNTDWTIVHGTDLSPSSGVWTGETDVLLNSESGSSPADIFQSSNLCTGCAGGTTNNPDYTPSTPQQMTPGIEFDGITNLSDAPPTDQVDRQLQVGWDDAFECAGCSNVSTLSAVFPATSAVMRSRTPVPRSAVPCRRSSQRWCSPA